MANFTELFTATLNETLAKMVADAMVKYVDEIGAMQARITELEEELASNTSNEIDRVVERAVESAVEKAVDDAIDNYDFSTIIRENTTSEFDSQEFSSAVKGVFEDELLGGQAFIEAIKETIMNAMSR